MPLTNILGTGNQCQSQNSSNIYNNYKINLKNNGNVDSHSSKIVDSVNSSSLCNRH